jgi:hypothetical protein
MHRSVGGNLDFPAATLALGTQPRLLQLDFSVAEHHLARLSTIENHACRVAFSLLWPSRHLDGGQLQHGLKNGSAYDINELVAGYPALLDQFHHGQKTCPFVVRIVVSSCSLTFPCLRIVW